MTNAVAAAASSDEKTILGHPRGLFILFFTEMWERFSFYGMRGLLILYLTQHFLFSDEKSSLIYGAYTALVYVMTIIGGSLADKYLGARKAVTFGAILLVLGHFGMAFEGNGSKQLLNYNGGTYEISLDARGGDAKPMIYSEQGESYVNFTQTEMQITDPAAVGLPAVIDRDQYTTSVVTEEFYKNVLFLSLALLIAGVGFLKANISTIVGSL
jgi:POT family proton-dependent oligopeptide transporter